MLALRVRFLRSSAVTLAVLFGCGETRSTAGQSSARDADPSDGAVQESDGADAAREADGADAAREADVLPGAEPPADCIPACLWALLKECLPSDACFARSEERGLPSEVELRCEPDTGWYSETFSAGQAGTTLHVYANDRLCYSARWGGASPVAGTFYSSPDGEAVALVSYDWTSAACNPLPQPMPEPLSPTRPDCAEWIARVTPGVDCAPLPDGAACIP